MNKEEFRPRLSPEEYDLILNHRNKTFKDKRILVIGDLHSPFLLEEYIDFCLKIC